MVFQTPPDDRVVSPEQFHRHRIAELCRHLGRTDPEVTMTSPTAPGVTHRWTNMTTFTDEVANARIWAGFHYRFSTEVGKDMGRKIGELVVATQLRGVVASAESKP